MKIEMFISDKRTNSFSTSWICTCCSIITGRDFSWRQSKWNEDSIQMLCNLSWSDTSSSEFGLSYLEDSARFSLQTMKSINKLEINEIGVHFLMKMGSIRLKASMTTQTKRNWLVERPSMLLLSDSVYMICHKFIIITLLGNSFVIDVFIRVMKSTFSAFNPNLSF